MSNFFKRLIYTRLSMNLSKKEFGELGGVSDVSQGRYEEEDIEKRRFPDTQYLINLEKHGIDISYLLTGKSSSNNLDADESLLLETFRNSSAQSKKLMLDLCRTLSGLPEQPKKKDDQDSPKSGSKQKIGDINAGSGTIGDIMNDSVKNTTYNITDNRTKYELDLNWEDASEKMDGQENFVRALTKFVIGIGLILFAGEMLSYSSNPTNELEQFYELLYIIGLPITTAFIVYREATKKITSYFNNKRKRVKRDIYLG